MIAMRGPPAMKPSRSEATAKRRSPASAVSPLVLQPARLEPGQVVGRALALAALGPGDDRPVAAADVLLQLRLGLAQRARAEVGGLGAELEGLVARQRAEADVGARVERRIDRLGLDVEVVRVGGVKGGADVLPVVGQRRADLGLLGQDDRGVGRREVQEGVELVDGQQLGDVRTVLGVGDRGDLGGLAVLGAQLGGGAISSSVSSPASAG